MTIKQVVAHLNGMFPLDEALLEGKLAALITKNSVITHLKLSLPAGLWSRLNIRRRAPGQQQES
jgi:hypothetical protein